jgi:hypothetical protein
LKKATGDKEHDKGRKDKASLLFEMYADDDLDVCGGNSFVVLEMSRVRHESPGVILYKFSQLLLLKIKTTEPPTPTKFKASV